MSHTIHNELGGFGVKLGGMVAFFFEDSIGDSVWQIRFILVM